MLTALALSAHHFGGGFGFGWLFLLVPLFWIGVVILIVALARRRWSRRGWGPGGFGPGAWGPGGFGPGHFAHYGAGRSAEATLAERFAQGDIEEQEYRARLEVLRANSGFTPPPTR